MALRTDLRVLVVDDMSVSRQVLGQMLDQIGIRQVITCASAEEALAALAKKPIDLVISDLNMPGMDGIELLKAMRGISKCRATPFILTSALDSSPRFAEARANGMRSLLIKPFQIDLLLHCVEHAFGRI